MPIVSREPEKSAKEIVIEISGRFDFSEQKAFRDAYRDHDADKTYRVDLSRTDYLDSSALGMLLLLRKHAGDESQKVRLTGASGSVKKILDIANFDKLFKLE